MLILEMIIRITGWTQEKLADFLGVSRVTINYWLNGNDISNQSKRVISEKFNFPINFFDVKLDENIETYKIIYTTLYKNIKDNIFEQNPNSNKDKINDILSRIEIDDKSIYNKEISDNDIIDGLAKGYNPFTGEIYSDDHILNNEQVKMVINKIKNTYYKFSENNKSYDDLNDKQKELFDKLKIWRKNKMFEEGFYNAYIIFTNKELINIICANINSLEDLLNVKGIGPRKYEKYGKEIFDILKEERE